MPPISLKKIAVVLLLVIALSRRDRILAAGAIVYEFFCDALAPFFEGPRGGRFVVAVAILALLYVTAFRLLQDRNRR